MKVYWRQDLTIALCPKLCFNCYTFPQTSPSIFRLVLHPNENRYNTQYRIPNPQSQMATWQCIKECGACCHLDPAERPDLDEYLSPLELELYLSMVGEGGWCINFDHATRECRIYSNRPRFCRVESEVFQDLYGIEAEELNDFAIDCCRQQIEGVYGDRSLEILRFDRAVGL